MATNSELTQELNCFQMIHGHVHNTNSWCLKQRKNKIA